MTATARDAAEIVAYVGDIVGKTRLQKTAAILELAGLGAGFSFSYHLFGPYSEDLAGAVDRAVLLGLMTEDEKVASWGGNYSVFHAERVADRDPIKASLIESASKANAVVLELAVTAAFLASKGEENAWDRVRSLKSEKATPDNLDKARALYRSFLNIETPNPLPHIG